MRFRFTNGVVGMLVTNLVVTLNALILDQA